MPCDDQVDLGVWDFLNSYFTKWRKVKIIGLLFRLSTTCHVFLEGGWKSGILFSSNFPLFPLNITTWLGCRCGRLFHIFYFIFISDILSNHASRFSSLKVSRIFRHRSCVSSEFYSFRLSAHFCFKTGQKKRKPYFLSTNLKKNSMHLMISSLFGSQI